MSEEDLTIKTSIQHIRFQWQQQLFVPVCDLSIKFCNLYSVSNRFIYFFDPKLFGDGHIRRLRQLHVHMGYWSQFWSCREHQNVIVASITFIRLVHLRFEHESIFKISFIYDFWGVLLFNGQSRKIFKHTFRTLRKKSL